MIVPPSNLEEIYIYLSHLWFFTTNGSVLDRAWDQIYLKTLLRNLFTTTAVSHLQIIQDIKELSFCVKSLKVGRTYEFRLSAVNSVGSSGFIQSEAVAARDVVRAPNPPTHIRARLDKTEKRVLLSWKAPEFDGGSTIKSYLVEECRETNIDKWNRIGETSHNVTIFKVSFIVFCLL